MKLASNKSGPPKGPSLANPRPLPSDSPARLIGLLLAFITVLVYLPAGFHEFIDFDDLDYVTENAMVQNGLTWAGLKWAFIGWHASNWHPLTWLSHELDCQLFGLNAGAHHLVNVLFHVANTVLLFQLWLRLTKACWPSAFVAALFAWHPLHVESVAWVAERKDVLSTFFGLLAMLAYARYVEKSKAQSPKSKVWYGLCLLTFALGLLAKPMLVTLPFVLLLLDYWPLERLAPGRQLPAQLCLRVWEKWPFFLLSVLACVPTWLAQQQFAIQSLDTFSLPLRLENIVTAYASYLEKTVWPVHLCVLYPLTVHLSVSEVLLSVGVLVAISLLVWRWRRQRYLTTGWLWFLGMLVPVIGLVQVGGQAMADRYMYLPAVGLFVALAFGMAEAQMRWKITSRSLALAAGLILAGGVALTEYQLTYWRNSIVLFEHALALTKDNGMAHMMLGVGYEKAGRDDEARQQYHKALDIYASVTVQVEGGETRPLSAQVQLLLGQSAEQKGQVDEAIAHYREVLRLDPKVVEAHNNLGNLLDDLGKSEEALAEYRTAVRLQPKTPLVHENLGTQLAKMGRFEEAMPEYQEAVRLAPDDPQPVYLIGKAWLRRGNDAEAVTAFQNALRLNPNDCPSLVYLARLLAADETTDIRNGARAVTLAEQANKLTGGTQPSVMGTLAMAYAESGRFDEARRTAQAALDLAGNGSQEAISNLHAQLQLYEANQPFRESFTNRPSH